MVNLDWRVGGVRGPPPRPFMVADAALLEQHRRRAICICMEGGLALHSYLQHFFCPREMSHGPSQHADDQAAPRNGGADSAFGDDVFAIRDLGSMVRYRHAIHAKYAQL